MLSDPFNPIRGTSAAAEIIRGFGRRAAAVDAPVLLTGESGTGKGVLARAIHEASARARAPFVAVNCAAVPDTLFESEFFGHVRGAFTGAQYAHKGLFEQADGGTLFLDELGELPLPAQAKLLTAIEDRQVRRLGGERVCAVNVRVISATACDLRVRIAEGRFRGDLYHRLAVLPFRVPPLRERGDDVVELALSFLERHAARYNRGVCVFDGASLEQLAVYSWPGNVRELSNAIECALVASSQCTVSLQGLLWPQLYCSDQRPATERPLSAEPDEPARIKAALEQAHGNRAQAARSLGMGRTTLWQKLKQLDAASGGPEHG